MTIRVRCDGCSAVMKVKDELAGAKGKCPKCKATFVIPAADPGPGSPEDAKAATKKSTTAKKANAKKSGAEKDAAGETSVATMETPIDLPLEPTPPVPQLDTDEFNPMAALTGGSSASLPAVEQEPIAETPNKPSIAELMKEHEEKKGKRSRRKDKTKPSKADELAQPAMTAGTAADALNRKYDQKRDEANAEEPVMTREERRAAEQREAMIDFAKKGIPALAGVLVLAFFFISYMFSEPLPDLGYVTGKVTRNGAPLIGATVLYTPKAGTDENSTTSTATTDGTGYYEMMYNRDNEGVIPGNHVVSIQTSSGVTFTLPPDQANKTVEVGESHEYDFNL